MPAPMHCEIVTPERSFYEQEAIFVVIPSEVGEMGVYAKHAPTVATLKPGAVKVIGLEGEESIMAVGGGYAAVDGKRVIVLANRAMMVSEIDIDSVTARISELEKDLAELKDDESGEYYINGELAWNKMLRKLSGGGVG